MVETLRHEEFYVGGTWTEESLGIYCGWVARKNSFADRMPLRNERGDIVLVFSGEEFGGPGTARWLKQRGHEFDEDGPSYLVHLSEEDQRFPLALNGRFHGLLADRNRRIAVLFNDRYGMHRIYYHESKDAFYFAAEAKAILAVCPELRTIDSRALGQFVACGCTLENRSVFEGVRILPPGSRWLFRNASLAGTERYFDPKEWENQARLKPEAYYREIREVFSRNLPRFFNGPEKIGMSLTGGLDTRMIMAWQERHRAPVRCYTFGGMLRDCQDVMVAGRVARVCATSHEVIRVGQEFLSRFPYYAERSVYLTDGCVDVSRAPDLYLNERARQIAPVRMTGNYGGEVLRKVRAFKPEEPHSRLFAPEFFSYIRQTNESYLDHLRVHPVSFAVFKQCPWYHHGILALEETQLSVRSPFLDNEFVRAVFRAPESDFTTGDVSLRLIADGNISLLRIPTDRGLAGDRGRLLQGISHALLEFLFKAEYAYDIGMPQWLARADHVFSPFRVENLILGRHKIFHFRVWYRDYLAGYLREISNDSRSTSRSYLDRRGLETVVRGHLKGEQNYTREIHKVLTLELLHRLFIDWQTCSGISEKRWAAPVQAS